MTSERAQRRLERLHDRIDAAEESDDWRSVQILSQNVLAVDPDNAEATAYLEAAERWLAQPRPEALEGPVTQQSPTLATGEGNVPPLPAGQGWGEGGPNSPTPTSFANNRYQVSKFLGEGGKKRVYQAHDTLLDREVAFALIKTEGFDQTSKERISREAQAMGRLGVHPNIVAVLDLGQEDDGTPYMVTELMGGGDVEGLLEEAAADTHAVGANDYPPSDPSGEGHSPSPQPSPAKGRGGKSVGLSLALTIEISKAVCEGLEFAHARGIVHRDLKPGNVWLTEDGTAKIGDFGQAVMTDRSRLTREGMMVGTVSYMPPEQATGGEITPKADLYSLGAMLYEMVTGRPPFLGDEEIAIIGQHINTPPVAPTWHNGTCPRPLEALIMRLLAKDPSERPDSAQDVFNALEAIDLTARGETVERETNSLESLAGGVFVGRRAEMDQLKAALEDVLGGRGRLVTLVGEPGIGKTRTCEELATYAGLRGAQVLFGRCYEGGGAPPYWPWVQAIRSYVRDIDADELRRQMGSSASVVAEIVTDVKDRLPDLQPPPQMDDPDSARFRLFDSITSFLRTASQSRPLVIVLDDLHWSDQPSLTFLEFIARELNQSRVMLLCTYRDMELNRRHPLSVTLGDLARERLYERVLLRGLTETDIARFIEIAAGFSAPSQLSATVQRHTEGNPLFVTEVIRDLVESGELTEEKVSVRSTWSVRIPEGVREVIGRRLDRLSDRANEILITAAVVGREFTLDILKALHGPTDPQSTPLPSDENFVGADGYPPGEGAPRRTAPTVPPLPSAGEGREPALPGKGEGARGGYQSAPTSDPISENQLLDVLDEALDARIIEELTDTVGHYQFTHALMQETLTGELSLTRRVRLHARIAETLEQLYGEEVEEHAAVLAHHFGEAEAVVGAGPVIKYSLLAADNYLTALAHQEAANHLDRVIELRRGDEMDLDLARARAKLGQARAALGEHEAAAESILAVYTYFMENGRTVEAVAMMTYPYQAPVYFYVGPEPFDRLIESVPSDSAEFVKLTLPGALIDPGVDGTFEKSIGRLDAAMLIVDALGDARLRSQTLSVMATVYGFAGRTTDSAVAADAVLAMPREHTSPGDRLRAMNWRNLYLIAIGDVDGAHQANEQFADEAAEFHERGWTVNAIYNDIALRRMVGEWEAVIGIAERGLELSPNDVRLLAPIAAARYNMGDLDAARSIAPEAQRLVANAGNDTSFFVAFFCTAYEAARRNAGPEELSGELDLVAGLWTRTRNRSPLMVTVRPTLLPIVKIVMSDDEAREFYAGMLAVDSTVENTANSWTTEPTTTSRARILFALGDVPGAIAEYRIAVDWCREHGFRGSLAWSCTELSDLLLDRASTGSAQAESSDREKAIELQGEALELAQDLGMRPLTERILARRSFLGRMRA